MNLVAGDPPPATHPLAVEAGSVDRLASIARSWRSAAAALRARPRLSVAARETIECQRALFEELCACGSSFELRVATADGLPQGIAALEPLEQTVFIHYLISAPWNALTVSDVTDLRTMRGACSALIADAVRRSAASGRGGLVSLEAVNDRCAAIYRHLGFSRIDLPRTYPADLYQPAEARKRCWMLLDGARSGRFSALARLPNCDLQEQSRRFLAVRTRAAA
jgi:hypothetical protein